MDRQIIYAGAVPLDTDQLLQSRNSMVALGYLAKMVVGDNASYADGLVCLPGPGLSLTISPGSLTLPTVVDAASVGALPPDGDPLLKIGINTGSVSLSIASPASLVLSGSVTELAAGSAVNAYYNASNPQQTLFGPGGNGASQASVLQQRVAFALTTANAVPVGNVPLWSINVPTGVTQTDATMIAPALGAPFLSAKLPELAPLASPQLTGSPIAPTAAIGDSSSLLATTAFVAGATRNARLILNLPGSIQWICPSGVSQILFRGWGPGGAGGAGSSANPGGGGGGGGYCEVLINVSAGQTYTIVVGAGGANSSVATPSSFGTFVAVFSGNNGVNGSASQPGAGGIAGGNTASVAGLLTNLGVTAGQAGYVLAATNVGGNGGGSFGSGQAATIPGAASGLAGTWPGGGGSGGSNGPGGSGANGLVIIEWSGKSAA